MESYFIYLSTVMRCDNTVLHFTLPDTSLGQAIALLQEQLQNRFIYDIALTVSCNDTCFSLQLLVQLTYNSQFIFFFFLVKRFYWLFSSKIKLLSIRSYMLHLFRLERYLLSNRVKFQFVHYIFVFNNDSHRAYKDYIETLSNYRYDIVSKQIKSINFIRLYNLQFSGYKKCIYFIVFLIGNIILAIR